MQHRFFGNFVWGKLSGRDVFEYMFLHLTSFNKRIIRILFTEWSQSDKMLLITESTKNNFLAHLDNFLFPHNHSVGLQGILITQLDQMFSHTCRIAVT